MNIYDKTLISQEWLLQFELIVKMKARDEAELFEYSKNTNHNPKTRSTFRIPNQNLHPRK